MDDFKKGVANVTRSIAKSSSSLLKTTKLTMDLSAEEGKLKALYHDIGKKVHEIYSYGGTLGEYFDKRYQDILEHQRKIDDLREALDIAKGVKTCPKCGKTSPRTSVFCPKCGEGMADVPEITADTVGAASGGPPSDLTDTPYVGASCARPHPEPYTPPPSQIPPAGKLCNVCGNTNDPTDRFCLSCGRIL